MNAKRILSLFLAAILTLGVAVTPAVAASAAPALPGSAALEESKSACTALRKENESLSTKNAQLTRELFLVKRVGLWAPHSA